LIPPCGGSNPPAPANLINELKKVGSAPRKAGYHGATSSRLIVAAFAPSLTMALGLLLVRAALSQMDVPTRSPYVMAVVTETERTAAASFTVRRQRL
jgi:hypothetical protein